MRPAPARFEKRFAHDLRRIRRQTPDRVLRSSALTRIVFQKRSIACRVCPWRCNHPRNDSPVSAGVHRNQRRHGAADRQFVHETSRHCDTQERRSCMQWSGQGRRLHHRSAAARLEKRQSLVPANLVLDSSAAVEIDQVGAASKQHMLAVINHLAGARMLIRGSAPAQVWAPFKERDAKSGFSQGASSSEAGQAASRDRDRSRLVMTEPSVRGSGDGICSDGRRHQSRRFTIPFPMTVSFSGTVSRTRSPKTSYCFAAIFSSKRR